jgi:signal peptidase I
VFGSIRQAEISDLWIELCTTTGRGWLTVSGRSMAPLIRPKDWVLVSTAAEGQIGSGDVVAFRRDNRLVVHRVLKKSLTAKGVYFIEKGDNLEKCRLVNADKIIGKVTVVKRNGKIFDLTTPLNRPICLVLSAWFYWTSVIVVILKSSTHRNVRRLGRFLSWLSLVSSNILIRSFFVIWYLSGFNYRKKREIELTGSLTNG